MSDSRISAATAVRSASPSAPPLDYLGDELATAFFNAREHEAYYRSLRTSARPRDARRANYDTLRPVLLRLLALVDDDGIVFLERLINANVREEKRTLGAQGQRSSIERVRRAEPRGITILGDDAGQDLERCRAAYRAAALRCHPDRGGSREDMVAVNRAFEMLHRLLVEEAGAAPIGSVGGEPCESSGETTNALAYLWMVRQLLLGIALDEWREEASALLEELLPVRAPRHVKVESPDLPFFIDDPESERISRTSDLMEKACKLTMRLCAAGRTDGAAQSLAIARELELVVRYDAARNERGAGDYDPEPRYEETRRTFRELAYGKTEDGDYKMKSAEKREELKKCLERMPPFSEWFASLLRPCFRQAEECFAGTRKSPVVLDSVKQVENAFRLGAIDEKRYKASMSRVAKTAGRVGADRAERLALLKSTQFAPQLPVDAKLKPSRSVGCTVPYPMPYQYTLDDLTPDQQAEYLRAFRDANDLDLAARYATFRLNSVFQSAILFSDRCNLDSLAKEADALAQIGFEYFHFASDAADIIRFITKLDGSRRTEFLSEYKKVSRPFPYLSEGVLKLVKRFGATVTFHALYTDGSRHFTVRWI